MAVRNYQKEYTSRIPLYVMRMELSLEELKEKYNISSIPLVQKWSSGTAWPPLHVALSIAEEFNTNLSYLLGASDIEAPNECYEPRMSLTKLREDRGVTLTRLATKTGTATHIIRRYESNPAYDVYSRINTLFAIAQALGVSLDYLLGLTHYENWWETMVEKDPFYLITPGEPAYLFYECEDSVVKGYCLLNNDGEHVMMPNGEIKKVDDELFSGVFAYPVAPTGGVTDEKDK